MLNIDIAYLSILVVIALAGWRFNISFRLAATIGLVFLISAALVSVAGYEYIGNPLAIIAYYFLLLSIIHGVLNYRNPEKNDRVTPPS